MTNMTSAQSFQQNNRTDDGRYKTKAVSEVDGVVLDSRRTDPFGDNTSNPELAKRVYSLVEEGDQPYLSVVDGYYRGSVKIVAEHEGQAQDAADKAVADGLFVKLKNGNELYGEEGAWTFDVADNDRYGNHTTWTGDEIDW